MDERATESYSHPSGPGDSLLRAITSGTTDAVFAKDMDGRYAWLNPKHARFLGRSADEMIGKTDAELFPPLFAAELSRSDEQVFASHEPQTYEIVSTVSGVEQVFLTTKSIYYGDDGKVAGLIGISRDVTEDRRREAELRGLAGGRAALVELGDAALTGTSIPDLLNMAARMIRENLRVELSKVLEIQPDGSMVMVAGEGWREGVVGSSVEEAETGSQAGYTLQQGGPVQVEDIREETRFKFPPVVIEHGVISSISTIIETDAGPFGVLQADSTRRRRFRPFELDILRIAGHLLGTAISRNRLERRLAAERQQLRVVMESTPVGILVADADSREVMLMNAAAAALFGLQDGERYSLDELAAAAEKLRPDGSPYELSERPIQRALQGESIHAEQVRLRFPTGAVTPVILNASPLYGPDGITGVVEVLQDVSAIEEVEQIKRDFQAMIAHDIRSPVASIKSAVELARADLHDGNLDEVTDTLDAIDSMADRLAQLARDVFDTALMEAGAFSVDARPATLAPLLEQAATTHPTGEAMSLATNVPADLPKVRMDSGRVLQVLLNLLSNAVRFADPGSTVRLEAEKEGAEVVVRVCNKGEAIPPEKAPLLFQKYSRIQEDERSRGGTGLGLAISQGIVEAHGGRIWMEWLEDSKETVFAFTLPVAES